MVKNIDIFKCHISTNHAVLDETDKYLPFISLLFPRCPEGFAGQRCQFKKALLDIPFLESKCFVLSQSFDNLQRHSYRDF